MIDSTAASTAASPMVSPQKILLHRERVDDFLAGRSFFPVTLELGLTTACNRSCRDCPSGRGRAGLLLPPTMASRILAALAGATRGLIVTGGEPTLHPGLAGILAEARRRRFLDVVVISNGSRLDEAAVYRPLLEAASTVRVSLYDWSDGGLEGAAPTLARVARLRERIERSGSRLQIGVSALCGGARPATLRRLAGAAAAAGAHWIYLHPTCVRPVAGAVKTAGGTRRAAEWSRLRRSLPRGFGLHRLNERFSRRRLRFSGYHAAHFIMVVGADGLNYLSSETKYDPRFAIADWSAPADRGLLRDPVRLHRIASVESGAYAAAAGRNRGVLYSDLLERVRAGRCEAHPPLPSFMLPHII